ncbi:MAG: oligosaccharide flippase family protein, partial [Gammaproteobacteria bacterium]|nr:oligosaccharide flippase family protein [Gammaproteobacteria bacterium]
MEFHDLPPPRSASNNPAVRLIALRRLLRKRLVVNTLALYVIQGLNYLSPIIVLPFLLRALKPDGYGMIVLAQSLMGYAVIVTTFGFNLTAARDVSVSRDDPERLTSLFWSTIAAQFALFAIAMGVTGVVVLCVPAFRSHWPIFLAAALLPLGSIAFPQWYFQGLERLSEAAVAQAISKVTLAIAIIAVVRRPDDAAV